MDILRRVRDLEAKIARKVDRTVGDFVQSGTREPLEIVHAIVDATVQQIQASGRGRRVFPFDAVTATVAAPSRDARARFEAVLADGPSLRSRIIERLRSAGCDVTDVDVTVNYVARAPKSWASQAFHIEFARATTAARRDSDDASKPVRIDVTVLHGVAERRTCSFVATRIDLGRCAEVRDSNHRLIRTNHVAFVEGSADVNQSVSRRHAHISYEPRSRGFRLHDDGSEHGTGIVRTGRTVAVPRGPRGVRLHSGDEIVLGEARVRVRFDAQPAGQTL
jgi:pSer/pThr/pTyr-binding forkhead associated (FHA) protein